MRRTQTDPREDLKEMCNAAICLEGTSTTATLDPCVPKRKRRLLTPHAQPGTITCEGCSQRSCHASPTGEGEAERASWRPEEEADGEQLNIPSAQDELHTNR